MVKEDSLLEILEQINATLKGLGNEIKCVNETLKEILKYMP